jgi:hypothetical protein
MARPNTPRSGRGGRRFKSCHSDQHLAYPQDSGPTVSPTDIAYCGERLFREAVVDVGRMVALCFAHLLTINAWLEVRVLPTPPRSLAQTEISRFSANSPELAAIRARILSLQSAH